MSATRRDVVSSDMKSILVLCLLCTCSTFTDARSLSNPAARTPDAVPNQLDLMHGEDRNLSTFWNRELKLEPRYTDAFEADDEDATATENRLHPLAGYQVEETLSVPAILTPDATDAKGTTRALDRSIRTEITSEHLFPVSPAADVLLTVSETTPKYDNFGGTLAFTKAFASSEAPSDEQVLLADPVADTADDQKLATTVPTLSLPPSDIQTSTKTEASTPSAPIVDKQYLETAGDSNLTTSESIGASSNASPQETFAAHTFTTATDRPKTGTTQRSSTEEREAMLTLSANMTTEKVSMQSEKTVEVTTTSQAAPSEPDNKLTIPSATTAEASTAKSSDIASTLGTTELVELSEPTSREHDSSSLTEQSITSPKTSEASTAKSLDTVSMLLSTTELTEPYEPTSREYDSSLTDQSVTSPQEPVVTTLISSAPPQEVTTLPAPKQETSTSEQPQTTVASTPGTLQSSTESRTPDVTTQAPVTSSPQTDGTPVSTLAPVDPSDKTVSPGKRSPVVTTGEATSEPVTLTTALPGGNATAESALQRVAYTGIVIGSVVGAWVVLAPAICLLCHYRRKVAERRRKNQERSRGYEEEYEDMLLENANYRGIPGNPKNNENNIIMEMQPLQTPTSSPDYLSGRDGREQPQTDFSTFRREKSPATGAGAGQSASQRTRMDEIFPNIDMSLGASAVDEYYSRADSRPANTRRQ